MGGRTRLGAAILLAAATACAPLSELGGRLGLDPGPLRLADPVDASTRAKLLVLDRHPAVCRAWLKAEGVAVSSVADRTEGEFCSLQGAVRLGADLGGARLRFSPAAPVTRCGVAAALAVWRRQVVDPAAQEVLRARVSGVDHFGSYACRRVNNAAAGRLSGHARAAALDVAGFRLSDGRRITVARDWTGNDAEARFLRRVRDESCRIFSQVLSPDYNAVHGDHFHLGLGGYGLCR